MRQQHTRWIGMCALGTILAFTTGCNELLEVREFDTLPSDEALNDIVLIDVRVAGVQDQFYGAYDDPVMRFSNLMTDETINGVNWEGTAREGQRIVSWNDGRTEGMFEQLARAHITGKDLADQIRVWQAADPETWVPIGFDDASDFDEALATALVFAGYSLAIEGEVMCQGVVSYDADEPSSVILSQSEIFDAAIPFLIDAEAVAAADGEDDLANLARVGLARANLGRANWVDAANWGNLVPAGFEWWMEYVVTSGGRNPLEGNGNGGNFFNGIHPKWIGAHPSFDGTGFTFKDNDVIAPQTDPRIQHALRDRTGHNGLTPLYKVIQGLRFGEYTGETLAPSSVACPNCTGTSINTLEDIWIANRDTDMLLADYTEAQHHRNEGLVMQGGNDAAVLTFVNTRRAVGNQTALVGTGGQDLIDELRNQRARDLYFGGFRLGDLRRWTQVDPGNGPTQFGGSYFPTGVHENAQWGDYGIWTCYPIPLSEYIGNLNLTKPNDPSVPPAGVI